MSEYLLDKPFVYKAEFTRHTNSSTAGLLLSQLYSLTCTYPGGCMGIREEDWAASTGMHLTRIRQAINLLIEMNLVCIKKIGLAERFYYQINEKEVSELIE